MKRIAFANNVTGFRKLLVHETVIHGLIGWAQNRQPLMFWGLLHWTELTYIQYKLTSFTARLQCYSGNILSRKTELKLLPVEKSLRHLAIPESFLAARLTAHSGWHENQCKSTIIQCPHSSSFQTTRGKCLNSTARKKLALLLEKINYSCWFLKCIWNQLVICGFA
jgi:hypothetical protein